LQPKTIEIAEAIPNLPQQKDVTSAVAGMQPIVGEAD